MSNNDRIVYKRDDRKWVNKTLDNKNVSSLHQAQKGAESKARNMLNKSGGGELITKSLNGKIRSKDTIKPAKDPFPPKDTEN
jgi:hypothetical protein